MHGETTEVLKTSTWEKWVTLLVVAGSSLFVFWQLQPDLIFSNTTPTGGDMGAHVWGPAYLRDELLPNFRLSGWTPDWYGGFPAFQFYMVLPALAIVLLDIGLNPFVSIPIVVLLLVGSIAVHLKASNPVLGEVEAIQLRRKARAMLILVAIAAPLLLPLPYNIAFKLVAVSGVVLFPVGAWALGHLSGMRFPGPPILAVGSLLFAFDRSFNIYGGNIASTLAGEFAASISLTLSLVAIGFAIKGTSTNKQRMAAAIFIALTGLSHLLPAFFVLAALAVIFTIRLLERKLDVLSWMTHVGIVAGLLSAFWVLPFAARTDFLNDMGWERITIVHSPLVTRSTLNPSEVLSDFPPLPVLLILGVGGFLLSIRHRLTLGYVLGLTAIIMAAGFQWFPDGRLWNARILPFYYLCVTLLAAIGLSLSIVEAVRMRTPTRVGFSIIGIGLLLIPSVNQALVWPDPVEGQAYVGPVLLYITRVLAIATVAVAVPLELFSHASRFLGARSIVSAAIGVSLLVVSPARNVRSNDILSVDGLFWAGVLLVSIGAIVLALFSIFESLTQKMQETHVDVGVAESDEQSTGYASEPVSNDGALPAEPREVPDKPAKVPAPRPKLVLLTAPLFVGASIFVLLGLSLGVAGGTNEAGVRSFSLPGFEIASNDTSFIPGWAQWNFTGLQGKSGDLAGTGDVGQGGWEEYSFVQRTMAGVGEQNGCGRAMWEFAPELNRYGTTMAMMLLPLWTDGCIGSMEGLYFEATPSVPYHFLLQSDLSAPARTVGTSGSVGGPSRAMRDLPYGNFDIDVGVERMRELGVRYYMAFSPPSVEAARNHTDLTEIVSATPWVVFELEAPLVEGLAIQPVVLDGVRDHQDNWLDVGVEWFEDRTGPRPASSGPAEWASIPAAEAIERYEAPGTRLAGSIPADAATLNELLPVTMIDDPAVVRSFATEPDKISFSVDQVGKPVIVRTSAFPNWEARGAEGPFRVAPNFMVVVPTSTDVELVFARTSIDLVAIALTLLGFLTLWWTAASKRRRADRIDEHRDETLEAWQQLVDRSELTHDRADVPESVPV